MIMLFWESVKLAFSSIRINKMRSFLTMLGIIIGISAVISIVSIGDTMRSAIGNIYKSIGLTRAYVYINSEEYTESDLFYEEDFEKVKEAFGDQIAYIDADAYLNVDVRYGRKTQKVSFQGIREGFQKVQEVDIIHGRMLNKNDIDSAKSNIVIQDKTALSIFGETDVCGKVFRAVVDGDDKELLIVGVYTKEDSPILELLGGGSRDTAYVAENVIKAKDSYAWELNLYLKDNVDADLFEGRMKALVARMKNKTTDEVIYYSAADDMGTVDGVMAGMALAVGAIAGISLLVGGIGIMNIMLVSVTERTREIGIRKALGARTKDVLMQFLIESAIISAAGGAIGTALGIGFVALGGAIIKIPVVINPMIVVIAVSFSALVGIFFGIYPAKKAAGADPIEALRYE